MPVLTSCANCGMTVPLPDVAMKLPACPSCGGVLEEVQEVPDAEIIDTTPDAEPQSLTNETDPPGFGWKEVPLPPPGPPLSASWIKVRQGLWLMDRTLRIYFACWGLFVMALVAIMVYRVVDRTDGNRLLAIAMLAGCGLLLLTNLGTALAGLLCTAFDGNGGSGRWRIQAAVIFRVIAGLLFGLLGCVVFQLFGDVQHVTLALLILAFGSMFIAEQLFLGFLDQAAKGLHESQPQPYASSVAIAAIQFIGWFVIPLGVIYLFAGTPDGGGFLGEIPTLVADLLAFVAGILFGLGSVGMIRRSLAPVRSIREAIDHTSSHRNNQPVESTITG